MDNQGKKNLKLEKIEHLLTSPTPAGADLDAMERLHKLSTLYMTKGELEPILLEIVDAAISISDADFGNIQILDRTSSDLKIVAQRGFPDWWIQYWNQVSKGKGACGTALEKGERVIVEDVEKSPIFIGKPALETQLKAGVRAVQSTPLISRSGKPVGMFSTHFKEPHRPDDNELHLLDLLARQAADILDKTRIEGLVKASEKKYHDLFTSMNEGFVLAEIISDSSGKSYDFRYLEANPAFERLTGVKASDIIGRTSREVLPRHDPAGDRPCDRRRGGRGRLRPGCPPPPR